MYDPLDHLKFVYDMCTTYFQLDNDDDQLFEESLERERKNTSDATIYETLKFKLKKTYFTYSIFTKYIYVLSFGLLSVLN